MGLLREKVYGFTYYGAKKCRVNQKKFTDKKKSVKVPSTSVFAQIPFIWNFLAKFGRNWMGFWSWSWVIDAINIYLDLDLMSSTIWKEVMRSVELNWKEATKWVELNRKKVMNASLPFVSFQFNSIQFVTSFRFSSFIAFPRFDSIQFIHHFMSIQ